MDAFGTVAAAWWALVDGWASWAGYVLAFMAGVLVTLQLGIVRNTRQIRRNSETLRRVLEVGPPRPRPPAA